jgi:hypothetical protein
MVNGFLEPLRPSYFHEKPPKQQVAVARHAELAVISALAADQPGVK